MLKGYFELMIASAMQMSDSNTEIVSYFDVSLSIILSILIFTIGMFLIIEYDDYSRFFRSIKLLFYNKNINDEEFEEVLDIYGYEYNPDQDIFCSKIDAWQREYGYCRLYDEAAPSFNMIMDSEPIYFEYAEKKWLIEFWKGQYGLTTGAEIGIYNSTSPNLNIPGIFNGAFYNCANDQELLMISFTLIKNDKILFTREDKHWWLTGFKLGEFSNPQDLSMIVKITFNDKTMRDAFVQGLKSVNYLDNEISQKGNVVSFIFNDTHVAQPYTRTETTDKNIQRANKELCDMYKELTKEQKTTPEKIRAIRNKSPELYQQILHMGRSTNIFKTYGRIKKHLA